MEIAKINSLKNKFLQKLVLAKIWTFKVVVSRLIEWHHKQIKHLGRTSTLGEVRACGYWLISANEQVRRVIRKCVPCKVVRGLPVEQKMGDLPESRSASAPPFTYCGVDACGTFLIKEGRN